VAIVLGEMMVEIDTQPGHVQAWHASVIVDGQVADVARR
jgi:hypothetical protein